MKTTQEVADKQSDFKTLSSLAFLSVCADSGADYVEYFEPFVKSALNACTSYEVNASDVQQLVLVDSGFSLPRHVIEIILKRLVKSGVLVPDGLQGRYVIYSDDEGAALVLSKRRDIDKKVSRVAHELTKHAQSLGIDGWNEDRSKAALFDLIDEYSRPLLNSAVFGVPLSIDESTDSESRYVFSTFANGLENNDPVLFDTFIEIVKGSMAANAVLYRDPSRVRARVSDLKLFLDTGFILSVLGYEGPEHAAVYQECVRLARKSGARLRVFAHTLDEVKLVLRGIADRLAAPQDNDIRHGGVFHFSRIKGWTSSDLRRFALGLESNLKKLGVHQEDFDYENYTPSYSEGELEERLQGSVKFKERATRHRDLRSIAGIMRVRGGLSYSDIETSKAIFVTTNEALMEGCLKFFGKGDLISHVPVVITSEFLTNLLWLKDPNVAQGVPRAKVVANIAAGLSISSKTWHKFMRTVERLAKDGRLEPSDVTLLRYSAMAPKEVMALTRGREDRLTDDSVNEVLTRIEHHIAGQAAEKLIQFQTAVIGPQERLKRVLIWVARMPSIVAAVVMSVAVYFSAENSIGEIVNSLFLSVVPALPTYWGASKLIEKKVYAYLRRKFIGTEPTV